MAPQGRKKGGYAQTVRVLRLLDYLAGRKHGTPLAALAERFGVVERQVRRDLEALDATGNRVDFTPVDGRSHACLVEASSRALMVTRRERYTLLAVRHVFDVLQGTPFHEDVGNVYDKLLQQLPADVRAEQGTLAERFVYLPDGGTKAYKNKTELVDTLFDGVLDRRLLTIRYKNADGKASRGLLTAYGIVLYKNGLYVIGHRLADLSEVAGVAARTELPMVFNVERFVSVEKVDKVRFVPPARLKLHEQFAGSFGIFLTKGEHKVVVDFDASVRHLVEARVYHSTQKLHALPGGGLQMSFQVVNLHQVASWVLSFGPKAKAIEPPELVTRIGKEARETAKLYR